MGPILLIIFLSGLDDGTESTLNTFSNDTKLRGVADAPDDSAAL